MFSGFREKAARFGWEMDRHSEAAKRSWCKVMWRQASLPAVEPGFPARRKKPHASESALEFLNDPLPVTPFPGGRDAALYVRQGCLTPRRSGRLRCRPWSRASQPGAPPPHQSAGHNFSAVGASYL